MRAARQTPIRCACLGLAFLATPSFAMDPPVLTDCFTLDIEIDAAARKKIEATSGKATLSLDFQVAGKTFRLKPVNLPDAGKAARTGDDCSLVPDGAKLTLKPQLEAMEIVEGKPKFAPFPGVSCTALDFPTLVALKAASAKKSLQSVCKG